MYEEYMINLGMMAEMKIFPANGRKIEEVLLLIFSKWGFPEVRQNHFRHSSLLKNILLREVVFYGY